MVTKTIHVTNAVYSRLKALKRNGESFSDVVDRLTSKFALLELVGILDHASARPFRSAKRVFGTRLREGIESKAARRGTG